MLRLHFQRGVTLIEMMIGLVITAILFALAAPNFSAYIQNSKIRNAADAIQNGLALARSEAVWRNTNVQFALTGTDSSWTVSCVVAVADQNGDGVPDCPGANPAPTNPSNIQARAAVEGSTNVAVTTSEMVASSNTVAPTTVFTSALNFNGLGRVSSTTLAPGDNAVFDIKNPAVGNCAVNGGTVRCLEVIVTSAGQIRMCDPALSFPDAQACQVQ